MQTKSNKGKKLAYFGFFLLIVIYIVAAHYTRIVAESKDVLMLWDYEIPLSMFAGALSSVSNICIILLVMFYKKPGLYTFIVIYSAHFVRLFMGFFVIRNVNVIPGICSNIVVVIAVIIIYQRNHTLEKLRESSIKHLQEKQKFSQRLFEQTATALVNAVDAKDEYSHGHSIRVAEHSEKIARQLGKSEDEIYRIYYTALLHDAGKIGIADEIIKKNGKLTREEYEIIKQHPVIGNQILSSISEYPYLSIGAHFHHERYDGKGYPEGLKGEDIPEIARIISVADAYDAMTSNRSYRDALPQQIVREEIVKNAGTQFDPVIAKIMQHLIDLDVEYELKERQTAMEFAGRNDIHCGEYRSEISDGIVLTPYPTKISLKSSPEGDANAKGHTPAIILFDSLDGRVHVDEKTISDLNYFEYCEIFFDGKTRGEGVRKIETSILQGDEDAAASNKYDIEAVKFKDHVLIRINNGQQTFEVTVALPDSSRYAYIGLTGENCHISNLHVEKSSDPIDAGYITRIAEEVSYIEGDEGDIPNVQIDGYRTDASQGIKIRDNLSISFHSMSLPTARLIWHCPFINVFSSSDNKVNGPDYKEYALVRFDGETWESKGISDNKLFINEEDEFPGWNAWKEENKKGIDCVVNFKVSGNKITMTTTNLGLFIRNTTVITDGNEDLYVAITGDQVAITDIRIGEFKKVYVADV